MRDPGKRPVRMKLDTATNGEHYITDENPRELSICPFLPQDSKVSLEVHFFPVPIISNPHSCLRSKSFPKRGVGKRNMLRVESTDLRELSESRKETAILENCAPIATSKLHFKTAHTRGFHPRPSSTSTLDQARLCSKKHLRIIPPSRSIFKRYKCGAVFPF